MELTSGQLVSQQYEIAEVLGRGGFGVVYRARDNKLEREVALKVLLSDADLLTKGFVERFRREIRLIRRLEHPNVVRLYDFGELEGSPYMVMEFVRGQEVAELLEVGGAMTWYQAQRIMLQMLDGLTTAHKLGIVHRDLKPNNLMLTEVGMTTDFVKILDFGIAKAVDAAERETKVTFQTQNQLVGTPSYMAPEQLRQEPIGPMSDVYATGLIFIELLTGEALLEGTMVEVVARHIDPRPHNLPPAAANSPFAEIIDKAISKDPQARFSDAAEMYEALREVQVAEDDGPKALSTGNTGPMPSLRQDSSIVSPSGQVTPVPADASARTGDVDPAIAPTVGVDPESVSANTADSAPSAVGAATPQPQVAQPPAPSPTQANAAADSSKLLPVVIGLVLLVLVGLSVFVYMLMQDDAAPAEEGATAEATSTQSDDSDDVDSVSGDPQAEGASGDEGSSSGETDGTGAGAGDGSGTRGSKAGEAPNNDADSSGGDGEGTTDDGASTSDDGKADNGEIGSSALATMGTPDTPPLGSDRAEQAEDDSSDETVGDDDEDASTKDDDDEATEDDGEDDEDAPSSNLAAAPARRRVCSRYAGDAERRSPPENGDVRK